MGSSSHNVIAFKSKEQQFEQWWKDVYDVNFKNQSIKSALVIYETQDKNGYQASHSRFSCDLTNLKWFHRCLGERIRELEFDKYLKENINKYIEYIE